MHMLAQCNGMHKNSYTCACQYTSIHRHATSHGFSMRHHQLHMHQLLNSGSAKILSTTNKFSQPEPSARPGEAKKKRKCSSHASTCKCGPQIEQRAVFSTMHAQIQMTIVVARQLTLSWPWHHHQCPLTPVGTCAATWRPFALNSLFGIASLYLCPHHHTTNQTPNVADDVPIDSHSCHVAC